MFRRLFSTTVATAGAPAQQTAVPAVPKEFFGSLFQLKNNPRTRYAVNTKIHSVVPMFARDELVPWTRKGHAMPNLAAISGIPEEYRRKPLSIRKNARHSMQSGSDNEHYWKVVFPRSGNWVNQLMGWMSAGDCLQATGMRQMRFDSSDSAMSFAKKMGFKASVQKPNARLNVLGKKVYDNNFLNQHVKKYIAARAPSVTMKTQFAHPERGQSAWVNLGNMAVQEGTSTHHTDKKVTGSQAFWDSKEFDRDRGAAGWRYDNNFRRVDELSRKLGK